MSSFSSVGGARLPNGSIIKPELVMGLFRRHCYAQNAPSRDPALGHDSAHL